MGAKVDKPDLAVARIAAAQHGVVTLAQLRRAGLGKRAIANRVEKGRLHRIHRGVYAVGHRGLSQHGDWMAAVLACGEGAVLSHTGAAALWGLLRPFPGPIHVTSPSSNGRSRRKGIALHRCASLLGSRVTARERIPVTTPQRTIDDLRPILAPYLVRRAIRQAEHAGLRIDARETRGTRSDLELDFLAFCARHGFPAPEVNVKVGRWEVDFLWRSHGLVVETDFFDFHRGSVSYEDDHQRELDLRRQGFAVRRYTGAQLDSYPVEIAAELGEVLGAGP